MHNMARTVFLLRQRMYCVLDVHQTVDSGRLTSKNLMKLATESSSRGVKRLRDDSDPIFPSSAPILVASDQLAPESLDLRNDDRASQNLLSVDEDALLVYRWSSFISKVTAENLEPAQLLEEQSIAKDDNEVAVDVEAACSGLCAILKRQPVIPYRSDSPETVKRQPELFGSDSSSRIEFHRVLLR
ncbi:hypothetical protein C8J56DRAFT_1050187 [Mycena floridula]|nr:hypothetical protein C8J56DRAFT_1050187 [Mycena floridula]